MGSLQDLALGFLVYLLGQESSTSGGLEDFADTLIGSSRALQVLVGPDLLANFLTLERNRSVSYPSCLDRSKSKKFLVTYLLWSNGFLGSLVQLLDSSGVVSKILLAANKDDRMAGAEMKNLGDPLFSS